MEAPPGFLEPSLLRRIAARFLDGLLFLPLIALRFVLDDLAFLALMALITGAYEITLVSRNGWTYGKRWMGLQVIDVRTGEVPSLNQAALRWVVPEVASLAPGLLGGLAILIIYVPVLQGPLHRGVHDHAAGTVVTASRR